MRLGMIGTKKQTKPVMFKSEYFPEMRHPSAFPVLLLKILYRGGRNTDL
jgi:hypothetical protein